MINMNNYELLRVIKNYYYYYDGYYECNATQVTCILFDDLEIVK